VKPTLLLTLALVLVLGSSLAGQTLSQNTNNTVITPGLSLACAQNGTGYTLENGFFRSFPLVGQPGNIDITSIRFALELATSSAATIPVTIKLFNDANGGAPSPYASLTLRHTESFTIPTTTTPTFITQALTGATVTFTPSETLVVEVSVATLVPMTGQFYIGANALGQSAPGYIRSASCGIADPTDVATVGGAAGANVHQIIEANYVPSGQTVPFPGTGEDLTLFSGVNANQLTTGIGNTVKTVTAGNTVTLSVVSTGGTFNHKELVVIGELYVTGFPPFPPAGPGVHLSFAGMVLVIGGVNGPLGPVLLPPSGTDVSFLVPPGLTGISALFQAAIVTYSAPFAANGLYATTDGHEIRIM
jgi:hypothetical protein